MSRYDFPPIQHPDGQSDSGYYFWECAFNEEQLKAIEKYGDELQLATGTVGNNEQPAAALRKTQVSWIGYNQQTAFLYDGMASVAQRLNAKSYRFDLSGFTEDFQYGVYNANEQSHYDWHVDAGPNTYSPRKLSLVLFLTDPSEYMGGKLQIRKGNQPMTVTHNQRGNVVAFPSYSLHRVTPVTGGIRKTIVVWVSGPPFR